MANSRAGGSVVGATWLVLSRLGDVLEREQERQVPGARPSNRRHADQLKLVPIDTAPGRDHLYW